MIHVDLDHTFEVLQQRVNALWQQAAEGPVQPTDMVLRVFAELQNALEELQVAQEELRLQNEELAGARQITEAERQRYQELFDFAPDGYLVTDTAGVIQEANRAAATLLAVEQRWLVGKPLGIFVAKEEHRSYRTQLNRLSRLDRVQDWQIRLRPRKGPSFPAAVTAATVYDSQGEMVSVRWVIRDITERKRAEQALQDSEERFRAIFDQAAVGIAQLSPEGTVLLANQRLCDMLGYMPEELLTRSWQEIIHPADRARGGEYLRRLLAGEIRAYTGERRYIRRDGTYLWGNVTASLVREPSGAPKHMVSVVQDITERKLAEEKTRQAEQTLRSFQEQLRDLATHLQERQEEERRCIAREIHDDLAQTLTALKIDTSWLMRRLDKAPRAVQERLKEMGALLDTLVSSVRRIGTELRPDVLDDLGLTAAIEWQLQDVHKRTGMDYELSLPSEDIPLDQGRATAMFRIFQEALTNVLRHAEASKVVVRVMQHADALLLEVADDGKGITPEQLTDRTSLGLLSMRERALLWGGELTIQGKAGEGTRVTVRIPYAPSAPEGHVNGSYSRRR
jgi:two-component system, NarL family, sensor histidine kinase UhpB